jgi:hypothetical protein
LFAGGGGQGAQPAPSPAPTAALFPTLPGTGLFAPVQPSAKPQVVPPQPSAPVASGSAVPSAAKKDPQEQNPSGGSGPSKTGEFSIVQM